MSHFKNLFFCLLLILSVSFLSCEGSIEPAGVIENEVNSLDDEPDGNSDSEDQNGDDDDGGNNDDGSENDGEGGNDSGDSDSNDDSSGDDTGNDSGNDNNDDGNGNTGDGDNDTNDNATVLGEWRLISAKIENGQASTLFNGTDVDFPFSATSKDEDAQVLFSENPDEVNGSGQFTSVISYTLFSQTFTDETTLESPITNGTWTSNGNRLTIVDNDGMSNEFSINDLSGSSLIIETSFERSIVLDGLDVDTNGLLILEFVR